MQLNDIKKAFIEQRHMEVDGENTNHLELPVYSGPTELV